MRKITGISLAGVSVFAVFLLLSNDDDSAKRNERLVTRQYLTEQFRLIHEGTTKADAAWTPSGKLNEMKKAFSAAQQVKPPPGADEGAVLRFDHYLTEGIEFFDSADGEWTLLRDFVIGAAAGYLDANGGMGTASAAAFASKAEETARDEAEKREFIQSEQELQRYIADEGFFKDRD